LCVSGGSGQDQHGGISLFFSARPGQNFQFFFVSSVRAKHRLFNLNMMKKFHRHHSTRHGGGNFFFDEEKK